jgi:hypothetical protein
MKQKQALSHRCVTPARVTKYYKMHTRGFSNPVRHGVAENPINQGRGVSDKSEPQETRLTEETQVKPDERNCGFVSLRPRRFRRNQEAREEPHQMRVQGASYSRSGRNPKEFILFFILFVQSDD